MSLSRLGLLKILCTQRALIWNCWSLVQTSERDLFKTTPSARATHFIEPCHVMSPNAALYYPRLCCVGLRFKKHCCVAPTVDYVCVMRVKVPLGRSRLMWGYSQEDERQHLLQTHRFSNQAHSLQATHTHVDASWCPAHTHNKKKHQ